MEAEDTRPLRTRSALRVGFRRTLPDGPIDEPMLVWVRGEDAEANLKLREALDDDAVALTLRGFRTVRVDVDAIGKGSRFDRGRGTPRLLVVRPGNGRVDALDGRALSTSRIYSALRRVANGVYEERVESLVRESRPLIETLDRLGALERELRQAKADLDPERASDRRRAKRIDEELDEILTELDDAESQLDELWTLTRRA